LMWFVPRQSNLLQSTEKVPALASRHLRHDVHFFHPRERWTTPFITAGMWLHNPSGAEVNPSSVVSKEKILPSLATVVVAWTVTFFDSSSLPNGAPSSSGSRGAITIVHPNPKAKVPFGRRISTSWSSGSMRVENGKWTQGVSNKGIFRKLPSFVGAMILAVGASSSRSSGPISVSGRASKLNTCRPLPSGCREVRYA
jgi:hypothetical protein